MSDAAMPRSKYRTKAEITKTRQAILDHFAERKTPCRPHPAMRYDDLAALVKEGRLGREVRREKPTAPWLAYTRRIYYWLVREDEHGPV
jgi:hypothetical protein